MVTTDKSLEVASKQPGVTVSRQLVVAADTSLIVAAIDILLKVASIKVVERIQVRHTA